MTASGTTTSGITAPRTTAAGTRTRLAPNVVVRSAGFPWAALEESLDGLRVEPGQRLDEESWRALRAALRTALVAAFDDDLLRRALLWQNPTVARDALPLLAARPADMSSRQRRRERMLVRYLARYHARAETIGFFGPASWARLDDDDAAIRIEPAEPFWAVTVESWAVAAVADAVAADLEVRRHTAAWSLPDVWLSGRTAVRARTSHRLGPDEVRVLAAVDGRTTVAALAASLGTDEAAVDVVLDGLAARGLVHRGFRVDTELDAWCALRDQLADLPAGTGRERALATWARVDGAVRRVAEAGTAHELQQELADLSELFAEVTERGARRTAEEAEGRGLGVVAPVASHARRVAFGRPVRDDLQRLADVLVHPSRWLCGRAGAVLSAALDRHLATLREDLGIDEVPLGAAYAVVYDVLDAPGALDSVMRDFWAAWERVLTDDGALPLPGPEGEVDLEAVARRRGCSVEEVLAEAFPELPDAPVVWGSGHLHSPDVLLAVPGGAAADDGEHRLVLGEVHIGSVTSDDQLFAALPQGRQAIAESYRALGSTRFPRYLMVAVRGREGVSALNDPLPQVGDDACTYLTNGFEHAERRPERGVVPVAGCVIRRIDDVETVVLPDGGTAPLLTVLGEAVSHVVSSMFSMIPSYRPAPRVLLGPRVVLHRRRWVLPVGPLADQLVRDDRLDVATVTGFLAAQGVSRRSFWRSASGRKPIFLDLHDPLTADLLVAELLRADPGAMLQVVEMAPGPDELWFPGPDGRPVTSELRMTFADG